MLLLTTQRTFSVREARMSLANSGELFEILYSRPSAAANFAGPGPSSRASGCSGRATVTTLAGRLRFSCRDTFWTVCDSPEAK